MKPVCSHFFKHLLCSSSITTHFSGHRIHHRLIQVNKYKSSSYFCSKKQKPPCWLDSKLATFSTISASSSSVKAQTIDSFTAPYLSVNIRCQKNVAVSASNPISHRAQISATQSGMTLKDFNLSVQVGNL